MANPNPSPGTSPKFPQYTTDGATAISLVIREPNGAEKAPRAIYFAVDGVYTFTELDGTTTTVDAVRGLQLAIAPATCTAATPSGLKFNALY